MFSVIHYYNSSLWWFCVPKVANRIIGFVRYSVFQKWDKSKILQQELAFVKTVFNLCFINDDLYLLNRIQSPGEHPPIIYH